jgi:hypothetical protein
MSDSVNQPLSARALFAHVFSIRNNFKESLDEIGAKIVEHVQSKGSQEQLLIYLDI